MDKLLAELAKKNEDLLLAARYGRTLLDEKDQLRNDLQTAQDELKQLEQCLTGHLKDSQRAMLEARRECDDSVSDLETKLSSTLKDLHTVQRKHQLTKDEHEKKVEHLQTEILALRNHISMLSGEKELGKERVKRVSNALKLSESQEQQCTLEQEQLQQMVVALTSANETYSKDLSTLTHTCDHLSTELNDSRGQLELWDTKYSNLQHEFECQSKELIDSQEIVRQLEIEIDRQRSCVATPGSTRSLHDELSESLCSLDMLTDSPTRSPTQLSTEQPLQRQSMQSNISLMEGISRASELSLYDSFPYHVDQSVTSTLRRSDHPLAMWSSTDDDHCCTRCQEMEEMATESQRELETVQAQLLMAVQQKMRLQEENEAWQSDMADLVQQNLHKQLENDTPTKTTKMKKKKDHKNSVNKYEEYVKYSWLF